MKSIDRLKNYFSDLAARAMLAYEMNKWVHSIRKSNLRCYDHMPENPAPERDFVEQPVTPRILDFVKSSQKYQGLLPAKIPFERFPINEYCFKSEMPMGMITCLPRRQDSAIISQVSKALDKIGLENRLDSTSSPGVYVMHFSPGATRGDSTFRIDMPKKLE